jgi:hypothetical protein
MLLPIAESILSDLENMAWDQSASPWSSMWLRRRRLLGTAASMPTCMRWINEDELQDDAWHCLPKAVIADLSQIKHIVLFPGRS